MGYLRSASAWKTSPPGTRATAVNAGIQVLMDEFGDAPMFLIKDPRLCMTLPAWLPALQAHDAAISVLLILRHPAAVAASLFRRNRLPESVTAPLWLMHCLQAERATRALPRAVVFYDDLLSDWRECMDRAGRTAGIAWPAVPESSHRRPPGAEHRRSRTGRI